MFKAGTSAYLFHYSKNYPYRCKIENEDENGSVGISVSKVDLINFAQIDPVVLCCFDKDDLKIHSCYIENIEAKMSFLELKVEILDSNEWNEKRNFERYSVSLYADLRASTIPKRGIALIKNISYSGMLIYTKSVLPDKEEFDIDLYADKKVIFLKARAMRSEKNVNYNEYGLQIVYSNYGAIEGMKQYVESLKVFHKKVIQDFENASSFSSNK